MSLRMRSTGPDALIARRDRSCPVALARDAVEVVHMPAKRRWGGPDGATAAIRTQAEP
jgi:hypothetical protein